MAAGSGHDHVNGPGGDDGDEEVLHEASGGEELQMEDADARDAGFAARLESRFARTGQL